MTRNRSGHVSSLGVVLFTLFAGAHGAMTQVSPGDVGAVNSTKLNSSVADCTFAGSQMTTGNAVTVSAGANDTVVRSGSLASSAPPRKEWASCSGDDCGCNVDYAICAADCPPPGDPNRQACIHSCLHESILCALACCGGCVPLYCGGV
jgi:hypothetical protein